MLRQKGFLDLPMIDILVKRWMFNTVIVVTWDMCFTQITPNVFCLHIKNKAILYRSLSQDRETLRDKDMFGLKDET